MADPTLIENPEEEVVQTDVQNQEIIENAQETGEIDFSAAPEENLQGINKVIEDGTIAVRDFIDNTIQGDQLSKEDIAANRADMRREGYKAGEAFRKRTEGGVASETIKAATGGLIDTVESVGSIPDLTGDTLKQGLNGLLGKPTDPTQDINHPDYEHGSWFEIPDEWEPENKTALGKFGRGMIEFGLLVRWTGAAGKKIGITRASGVATKGSAPIEFLKGTVRIGSEGAIADLISQSSEYGNIANLAEEHVPWLAPQITEALAINPEDNPWLARFKTVAAGSGMNYVAAGISGLAKGFWAAGRARLAGKTIDEANAIGNKAMADEIANSSKLDEDAATEMAANRYAEGGGTSHADPRDEYLRTHLDETEYSTYTNPRTSEPYRQQMDKVANGRGERAGDPWDPVDNRSVNQKEVDLGREPDPFVNPDQFDDYERATYRPEPDAIKQNIRGNTQNIATESYIRAVAQGNKDIKTLLKEVMDDMASEAFSKGDNTLNHEELIEAGFKRSKPFLNEIEAFADGKRVDLAKSFKQMLKKPKEYRLFSYENGEIIKTIGPQAKDANVIVLNALGALISDLSRGTMEIANDMPFIRQFDAITDAMKVLFIENKKYGMLWGLDGQAQQKGFLSLFNKGLKQSKEADIAEITRQADEYFGSLKQMAHDGRWEEARDLIELFRLTDGAVRTQAHIMEYLTKRLTGGRMIGRDGKIATISGRFKNELYGTFFNSILSRPRTGIKAVNMTNLVAVMRPLQTGIGAILPHRFDKKQIALAAVQWDSMFRSWKESWQMAVRNYKLGASRKNMDYQGKFDLEDDLAQWKGLKPYYEKYGNQAQQMAYGFIDKGVDFNTNPWVRYNQNAMGAGDAFARTNIARQLLALQTAQKGIESGVDLSDLSGWAARNEELFRKEIFKKNKDGAWIVSDKAAKMAGDSAALTGALEENFKGFELISNIPGMKVFFPFVRPGFHALDLTFQHTPLMVFKNKYRDLVIRGGRNLEEYGIRPENLAQEVALIEGRIAMGSAAIGIVGYAAAQGRVIGDLPPNKEDRDLWKLNGIQPNSFAYPKPGGGWMYFSFKNIEVFNTLFSMTANVVNNLDTLGEDLADHWMNKISFMASAVIVDNSMLQGMEGLMDLFDSEGSEQLKARFIGRTTRSFLPYSGLSADLGDLTDANRKEAQTLLETIVRRDVIVKGALPPRYDILSKDRSGKKLVIGAHNPLLRFFNSLSPVAVTTTEGDPIKEALLEIRYNLPEVLSTLDGEPLNSLEKSELERHMSQSKTLRPRLEKIIVRDKNFQKTLKEYQKRDLKIRDGFNYKDWPFYKSIDQVFRDEKKLAKVRMLADNNELKERITIRQAKKAAGKSGSMDRVDRLLSMPK